MNDAVVRRLLRVLSRSVPRGDRVCGVCWFQAWEPIESEAECVRVHPHEGEHEWCGHCHLDEQHLKLVAERDALKAEVLRVLADYGYHPRPDGALADAVRWVLTKERGHLREAQEALAAKDAALREIAAWAPFDKDGKLAADALALTPADVTARSGPVT